MVIIRKIMRECGVNEDIIREKEVYKRNIRIADPRGGPHIIRGALHQ